MNTTAEHPKPEDETKLCLIRAFLLMVSRRDPLLLGDERFLPWFASKMLKAKGPWPSKEAGRAFDATFKSNPSMPSLTAFALGFASATLLYSLLVISL